MIARIISTLCNLNEVKSNIIFEDEISDIEYDSNDESIKTSNDINSINILYNRSMPERNDSGSAKNEMVQFLILKSILKLSISLHDTENMIVSFCGSKYQNIKKWIIDFQNVISLLILMIYIN